MVEIEVEIDGLLVAGADEYLDNGHRYSCWAY